MSETMTEETPLTATEKILAPILAAWDAWRPDDDELEDDAAAVLSKLTDVFDRYGYVGEAKNEGGLLPLSAKGDALLERARKAGVL